MREFMSAINSLPRSVVLAIQFIAMGIFIGVWWAGNQAQISEVKGVKESVDKLRGEIQLNLVSKRDFNDLVRELNWRLKLVDRRLNIEFIPLEANK